MTTDNIKVKRSELKYFINHLNYLDLETRLRHVLIPDSHSSALSGYRVRSLYFDSIDDKCLADKQSGQLYRQKYRIRIYHKDSATAKFEIKHKLNNQIYKETATISRASAMEIIDGNYQELLKYNNPILERIYVEFVSKHYKPKVVVDYLRDAFIYDLFNIRITIDKDVRCSNHNFDIFSDDLHLIPIFETKRHILEVKFDQILPDFILNLIQISRFERMAISKYTLSRRLQKFKQWEDN